MSNSVEPTTVRNAIGAIINGASYVGKHVLKYRNENSILTLGIIGTIFTWGFIQGLKKYCFSPVTRRLIDRHIIGDPSRDDEYYRINGRALLAEFIEWVFLMTLVLILYFIFGGKEPVISNSVGQVGGTLGTKN